MEVLWWFIAMAQFTVGLIGPVAPFLPGTTIVFAAAFIHRIVVGPEKSIGWRTISILALLLVVSYLFDFLGAYFGAKYFGVTKWGTFARSSVLSPDCSSESLDCLWARSLGRSPAN